MTWFQFLQIIVIGLFFITLLMGLGTQFLNQSVPKKQNVVSGILKSIGTSNKEQTDKMKYEAVKARYKKLRESFNEHTRSQQEYIRHLKKDSDYIGGVVKDMPDEDHDVSLLPLKDLVKKFLNQSQLVINHQQRIESYNEEHKGSDSDLNTVEGFESALNDQRELLIQQSSHYAELKTKLDELREKLNKLADLSVVLKDPQFAQTVEALSLETTVYLNNLRQKQEQIQKDTKDNFVDTTLEKDKRDDWNKRNQVSTSDTHQRIEDQTRDINDRIRDQMERAREKARR